MKKTKIKNMFWKRETKAVNSNIGQVLLMRNPPPPPPKKEFETMLEILRDAEKYDNANEIDVRNNTLQNLVDYINDFRLKNKN
jgi:hypothetical protein